MKFARSVSPISHPNFHPIDLLLGSWRRTSCRNGGPNTSTTRSIPLAHFQPLLTSIDLRLRSGRRRSKPLPGLFEPSIKPLKHLAITPRPASLPVLPTKAPSEVESIVTPCKSPTNIWVPPPSALLLSPHILSGLMEDRSEVGDPPGILNLAYILQPKQFQLPSRRTRPSKAQHETPVQPGIAEPSPIMAVSSPAPQPTSLPSVHPLSSSPIPPCHPTRNLMLATIELGAKAQ